MSTVDSLLLLASSAVARDILQKVFWPDLADAKVSFYGKLTTLVIGLLALVIALGEVRVIFDFVLFAWSGLACAFAPVVLCSLFWKGATREGAIAGMIAGFLTAMSWVKWIKPYAYDLYEMIPRFAVAFLVTIAVSLATKPPAGAAEEMDEIHR